MKLYHAPTSVCSQKVRIGMAEMGLTYDSALLDLQKGDQFAPAYLALNPDAVVPTLVDGDALVVESSLIVEYLDRVYNEGRLMPRGGAGEIAARHWLLRTVPIHASINAMSFSTALGQKFRGDKTPEKVRAMAARMPDPVMAMKRADLILNGLDSAFVGQALMYLARMLDDMTRALDRSDWVTGPEFGIVDIALVAYVDRLDRLGMAGLWQADYPQVGDWLAAMQARPSYEAGIGAFSSVAATEAMRASGAAYWDRIARMWQQARSA